jgi:hypothetical protein
MALEPSVPAASGGAGYDDYEQNNNYAYRNSGGAGVKGTNPTACKNFVHAELLKMSVAYKFSKCKYD